MVIVEWELKAHIDMYRLRDFIKPHNPSAGSKFVDEI